MSLSTDDGLGEKGKNEGISRGREMEEGGERGGKVVRGRERGL